jgi:hypothetical protein
LIAASNDYYNFRITQQKEKYKPVGRKIQRLGALKIGGHEKRQEF